MSKLIFKAVLALLCFSFSPFLYSQETTSEISGTVSDGSTALAGATVTALNVPTGTEVSTVTRKDGRYNFPNLRVGGPYTVTVSFVGFKNESKENIFLLLG